ncbi:MAG: alpha/beta fold hydrolase [Actinomycetota bacterium]
MEQRTETSAGEQARERLLMAIPIPERRLEVAGFPTAVLEGGDGPPVVLLHGLGEFAATWMPVIPRLAAAHHVVVPDLPGQGASVPVGGRLDKGRVLTWLDELIERTCGSPPALVGHLMGGSIAARFAIAKPEQVRRLVLMDSYGLARFRPSAGFALAMGRFLARPTERSGQRFLQQCMFDLDGLRGRMGERWDPLFAYALDRAKAKNVRAASRSLMRHLALPAIPEADLARIEVPTFLIWGRHDRQVRLKVAEEASARYGWPLHVIEEAADDPAFERPEETLVALRTALEGPARRREDDRQARRQ